MIHTPIVPSDAALSSPCTCPECVSLCWHSPGWFGSIKEIEGAAKIKSMSVNDFVLEYLICEYWIGDDVDIFVPAPRKNFDRFNDTGEQYIESTLWADDFRSNGKGFVHATWGHNLLTGFACIFLTDENRCSIHESKPYECKMAFGCRLKDVDYRKDVLAFWEQHQEWVEFYVSQ